jgi:hypothetical protein
MNGNHHPDYKLWCLAKWLLQGIQTRPERVQWLASYQERHGVDATEKLKKLARLLHQELRNGVTPVYTGPYQAAIRPNNTGANNE